MQSQRITLQSPVVRVYVPPPGHVPNKNSTLDLARLVSPSSLFPPTDRPTDRLTDERSTGKDRRRTGGLAGWQAGRQTPLHQDRSRIDQVKPGPSQEAGTNTPRNKAINKLIRDGDVKRLLLTYSSRHERSLDEPFHANPEHVEPRFTFD